MNPQRTRREIPIMKSCSYVIAVALCTLLVGVTHAQTPGVLPAQKPAVAQVALPPPVQIVRKPTTLTPARLPVTNRVLPKSGVAELLAGRGRLPPLGAAPSGPPGKNALVVILENGGVMANVSEARPALDVDIRTVTCGNWEFQLRNGESVVDLVGRVAGQLGGNLACVNPVAWREQTFNPYDWLDEQSDTMLENAVTGGQSLLNTQSRYDVVVVLEDADAVPARVLAAIQQLAPTHVIDVHVLTHGSNNSFSGHNGASFSQSSFFGPLQAYRTSSGRLFLRAVYQMNCSSGTLKDEWTALGAVVVNGTNQRDLNNMPHQYFHFLTHWLNGRGMNDASQRSFTEAAQYTRPIYTLVGKGDLVDVSRLTAVGPAPATTVNSAL